MRENQQDVTNALLITIIIILIAIPVGALIKEGYERQQAIEILNQIGESGARSLQQIGEQTKRQQMEYRRKEQEEKRRAYEKEARLKLEEKIKNTIYKCTSNGKIIYQNKPCSQK